MTNLKAQQTAGANIIDTLIDDGGNHLEARKIVADFRKDVMTVMTETFFSMNKEALEHELLTFTMFFEKMNRLCGHLDGYVDLMDKATAAEETE